MLTMLPWTWLLIIIGVTWKINLCTAEIRVVCYYTNWSVYRPGTAKFNPQNINPYLCTHLIYAFGGFTKENSFKPFDKYQDIEKGGYAKFTGLKTYNKNLKTMLAVGGWNEGSSRFSPMVANADRRKEFVKNAIKFLRLNHFDGLDLDWEYPSFRDGGKPRDKDNYASLVQELREEFDRESEKTGRPRLLLTMAVPAGIEYINKGYDVPRLMKYLDWMNILSYDYHSAFEPAVNHHSPLYSLEEESEYNYDSDLNINHTINHYLEAGAVRDKLVLGIPTYGRSYTLFNPDATEIGDPADGPGEMGDATRENGYLAYYEICEKLKDDSDWTVEQPNPKAMGPYAFKDDQWVGYDDEDIVRRKAEFVAEKRLGGIMFWSIDNDDFRGSCHGKPYPLIEAAKEALIAASGSTIDNAISPPEKTAKSKSRPRSRPNNKKASDDEEDTKPAQNSGGRQNANIASTRKRDRAKSQHKNEEAAQVSNKRRLRVQKKNEDEDDEDEEEDEDEEIEAPKRRRLQVNKENTSGRRKQESKRRNTVSTTASSLIVTPKYTTPEPPTTPDPGGDFKCEDEGFYPHPRDCKKYFWCLSGPSEQGIIAHQFTCPSGLYFNKAADSCDYTQNVLCNKKKAKTTSTTAASSTSDTKTTTSTTTTKAPIPKISFTTRRPAPKITAATSRTTFVSSTTPEYLEEYEYEDEDTDADDIDDEDGPLDSEEDPRVIKELIALIKKAGGIEELEKQLNLHEDGSVSVAAPGSTTPPISKTLYERVLSRAAAARNTERPSSKTKNSRGPQYDGKEDPTSAKRGRPQYTAITRQRPSTEKSENEELAVDTEKQSEKQKFSRKTTQHEYITIARNRPSTTSEADIVETSTSSRLYSDDEDTDKQPVTAQAPEYVTLKRRRPTTQEPTPKYVTIRGRTSSFSYEDQEKNAETATLTNPSTTTSDFKTSELSNNEYINTVEQQNITDTVEVSKTLRRRVLPNEGLNSGTETIPKIEGETTQLFINAQNTTENSLSENEQSFSSSQRYRSSTVATVTDSTTPASKVSDTISRNVLRPRPFHKPTDSTDNSHTNNSTNITETTTKRGSNKFSLQSRFKTPQRRPSSDSNEQDETNHDEDLSEEEDDISNETDNPSVSDRRGSTNKQTAAGGSAQKTTGQFRPRPFLPKKPVSTAGRSSTSIQHPATNTNYDVNRNEASTEKSNIERQPTIRRGSAKYDYQDPAASGDGSQYYDDGSYHDPSNLYDRRFRPDIAAGISDLSSLTSVDISKPIDTSTESKRRGVYRQRISAKPPTLKEEPINVGEIAVLTEESSEDNIRTSLKPLPLTRPLSARESGKAFKRTVKSPDIGVPDTPHTIQPVRVQKENPIFIRPSTFRRTSAENVTANSTDSETTSVTSPDLKPRINFASHGRRRIDANLGSSTETESSNSRSSLNKEINTESGTDGLQKPKLRSNLSILGRRRLSNLSNNEERNSTSDRTATYDTASELENVKSKLSSNSTNIARRRLGSNQENPEKINSDSRSSLAIPINRNNRKVIRRFRPTTTSIASTSSSSTTSTYATPTTTEDENNDINSEINNTEQLIISTTTTAELHNGDEDSTEDKKVSVFSIIVTDDIKQNVTEGGSSDNDEDVYRTSEEEEENIKLSETSIREKSEIHINALNDNSDKHRRRVIKKIKNEGKVSQTKVNYLQEDEEDEDYSRNPLTVTEQSPILRTRKIIRKLHPTTTESIIPSTSEATRGRTRKIVRRLRPTTVPSTTQNTIEETDVTKNSEFGAKRIRLPYTTRSKTSESVPENSQRNGNNETEPNSDQFPKYGFRRRQNVNEKNESGKQNKSSEDAHLSPERKPVVRRISPLRANKVKFAVNREKAADELDNDEHSVTQNQEKSFGGKGIKFVSRNTSDNSENADTKQKPLVRRIISQRRQNVKINGSSEIESNKSNERKLQRYSITRKSPTDLYNSEGTTTSANDKTDIKIIEAQIAKGNFTNLENNSDVNKDVNNSTIAEEENEQSTEIQSGEEEETDEEEGDEDEEGDTEDNSTTIPENATTISTDSSLNVSVTEDSGQNLENQNEDNDKKSIETSTKFSRARLNRIQKSRTTTQATTTTTKERYNIFSRFNARRKENSKSDEEVIEKVIENEVVSEINNKTSEANNITNSELNNVTNADLSNVTKSDPANSTEENDLREFNAEITTTVPSDEENTTVDVDEVTQQTTIDSDFTVTDSSITTTEEVTKSTTIKTTTPFYYRAKLSRPPFLLQRNRAVTESSQVATATKESSRSTGFSPRYNARRKDKYKSRFDKTTSTESIAKIVLEDLVNVTEAIHNQTTESDVNVTVTTQPTVSTSVADLQTTESESNNESTEDLNDAVTESITTTELYTGVEVAQFESSEHNNSSDNQTVSAEISTINATSLLEVTTPTSTSANTEEIDSKLIQNITDSILEAELLALLQQYDRDALNATEIGVLNYTTFRSENQTEYINQFQLGNITFEGESVTEEDNTTLNNSTTEDTLSSFTTRRSFVPRRRIAPTTQATLRRDSSDNSYEVGGVVVRTTPQRPKYKPRGKPTERTLLYKQTTRKITIANDIDRTTPGRNRLFIKPTTEQTKLDDQESIVAGENTENSEGDAEEDYDNEEDNDEEYENEEEQQVDPVGQVNGKVETTERTYANSFNRPNKPQYTPKRVNPRGSTERPRPNAPRRFGGARNNPVNKHTNNPAPSGNTEAKSSRNKLFNKSRKVNTPYPGISLPSTSPSTVASTTTTTETTSIITTQAITNATAAYQQENTVETTTTTVGTMENPSTTVSSEPLVTLHHIFSETESSTPITTEMFSEVTGASPDKKVERLIEVNRIVEVSLREGKFKHNAMIEHEVTLSPTLDRIGAINRVTVIKVVDPENTNTSEIISNLGSLKDADKLRLNVTLPTNDVNKQKSLINDIINAISSDLNTHAINISIINDLTVNNSTSAPLTTVEYNLVSNGTKLEEINFISTNTEGSAVTKQSLHKEDPNLIHVYSSGEVLDAIIPPHTQEEENLAKAQIRIDGKSVVNTFTPKPSLNAESSTIALEGLFQPDWNRLQRDESNGDEILQTQNANYVKVKILEQDGSSRRLKFNEEQPIVPIRLLKQDEYTTSKAQVIEITPEMSSGMIKIAPIAISVGSMHPIQYRQSEHTEHTTVVFPVSVRTTTRIYPFRRATVRSTAARSKPFTSTNPTVVNSRTTKSSRRKTHSPSPTTARSQDVSRQTSRSFLRFSSRKPFLRTTTIKSIQQSISDNSGPDQTLESSNQQSLEKYIRDDTTKLGDLASALNELQRVSVRPRNASRSYTQTVQNKVLQPVRRLISTTAPPVYATSTALPPVYSAVTILPPVYSTTFIVKQQQPRPFEKTTHRAPQPQIYQPADRSYDYYDDENTRVVSELPEHSKVLLHSSGIIQCLDQGNFPHPASCKKFIYCAKIDNGEILGWEYTCPKNLSFDPVGGICNWSADLGCGE